MKMNRVLLKRSDYIIIILLNTNPSPHRGCGCPILIPLLQGFIDSGKAVISFWVVHVATYGGNKNQGYNFTLITELSIQL